MSLERLRSLENLPTKEEAVKVVGDWIRELGFEVVDSDFERPWGGFWRLSSEQKRIFVLSFFDEIADVLFEPGMELSPKFLLVAPGKKLSWQYHNRRSECWRVVNGPVGVVLSDDDEMPKSPVIMDEGDRIGVGKEERHRLVGLGGWGLVAEIWIYTDPDNPSDEADIVRLADDSGRK